MEKTKDNETRTERNKGKSLLAFPADYTVVDIETTGFGQNLSIIEIGACRVRDNIITDTFSQLVRPSKYRVLRDRDLPYVKDYAEFELMNVLYVDSFTTNLTGITNRMLEDAERQDAVLADFLSFLGDDIIVGHNVNFDINILYDEILKGFHRCLSNDYVDTLRLSRKIRKCRGHKLSDLAQCFDVSYEGAHRALNDCMITKQCLEGLKNMAEENNTVLEDKHGTERKKN